MDPETDRISMAFELDELKRKDYATVLEKFDKRFIPNVCSCTDSKKGLNGKKLYVKALYELSEDTNFLNKKKCIRDSVVLGYKVQELSEKHQLQSDLSLDSYYSPARSSEATIRTANR